MVSTELTSRKLYFKTNKLISYNNDNSYDNFLFYICN